MRALQTISTFHFGQVLAFKLPLHIHRQSLFISAISTMTMFIKITSCNISRIGAPTSAPYIVIADNNGRQLKRTPPRLDGFATWDSEAFMCNDTLGSILLYVYARDNFSTDSLIGIGKFDFSQVQGLPYQKINVNVPIVMQGVSTGTISLEAEYNEGQIFIGQSSHMDLGSAVYRTPMVAPSLMVAGTNTSTIVQTPILQPAVQVPILPVAPIVQQRTIASVGATQDGLIPIQMVDFHPTYNFFSMWDVHYPDARFRLVQPHLRKVVYRD